MQIQRLVGDEVALPSPQCSRGLSRMQHAGGQSSSDWATRVALTGPEKRAVLLLTCTSILAPLTRGRRRGKLDSVGGAGDQAAPVVRPTEALRSERRRTLSHSAASSRSYTARSALPVVTALPAASYSV